MISLLLIFFSLNAHAEIQQGRIENLLNLSEQYRHDGANCFASVVYASGLIDDSAYIASGFYEAAVRTPYCQKLPSFGALQKGDVVVLGSPHDQDTGLWMHALLVLGDGKAFAKMGYKKEDKTIVTSLQENINFYRDQDSAIRASEYRCDFVGLRQAIEQSDLRNAWDSLLRIRQQLFKELRQEQTMNHEDVTQMLAQVDEAIVHSKSTEQIKDLVRELLLSTREQIHLMDDFIVEM
jgi:hypothetical protein